jgi:hypothetical protein
MDLFQADTSVDLGYPRRLLAPQTASPTRAVLRDTGWGWGVERCRSNRTQMFGGCRSRRPTEKKAHFHQKGSGLQSFDKAAISTGESWVYAAVAGPNSPVIVGWSIAIVPACPGPSMILLMPVRCRRPRALPEETGRVA